MTNYRLSEKEKQVIASLELDANASVQSIAKILRLKTHTVQYILNKLETNNIIKKSTFIDIHKLGLRYCGVFVSVTGNSKQKQSMISYLSKSNRVGWFAELGGEYAYGIALAVRNAKEADNFLLELLKISQIRIYKKAISFRLYLMDTPRQYLTQRSIARTPLSVTDGTVQINIDELDERILNVLSSSPELSYREMAKVLGIPHTTFGLRIEKLKNSGILVGTTLELDLRWLGREAFKILLYSRGKDPTLTSELYKYAIDHPFISHYIECFGEWDYELNVEVASLKQVSEVLNDLQEKFGERLVNALPLSVLKTHRVSRYPTSNGKM